MKKIYLLLVISLFLVSFLVLSNGGCGRVGDTCESDEDCDDEDPCTEDYCDEGDCRTTPKVCDNENECDGPETCDPVTGNCVTADSDGSLESMVSDGSVTSSVNYCDDGDPCTEDGCSLTGKCVNTPVECPSLNERCRSDAGGCVPSTTYCNGACGDPLNPCRNNGCGCVGTDCTWVDRY